MFLELVQAWDSLEPSLVVGAVIFLALAAAVQAACCGGPRRRRTGANVSANDPILDQYESLEEVQAALRVAGLESSSLVIGVDFTASNSWTGMKSFGKNLHEIQAGVLNPYQEALAIIAETLAPFDDDGQIPAFGFGDARTTDKSVFSINPRDPSGNCIGLGGVLQAYAEVAPHVKLAGPTSFAPLIRRAMDLVRATGGYHILLIVADGGVTFPTETVRSIVDASSLPLSIVMVGVGDGPWDTMERFDDDIPERQFDNFQFVNFTALKARGLRHFAPSFATAALQEIPEQFKRIRQLQLI